MMDIVLQITTVWESQAFLEWSHNGLELFYEVAERFVLSLGHAPEIDVGGFLIYEHRVLLEKRRGQLAETSDGISPQAREILKCCSSEVFDKEAAFDGISFAFFTLGSSHRDLKSLQVCLWIGCTVVRCYLDLSRIWNVISGDASSKGCFLAAWVTSELHSSSNLKL